MAESIQASCIIVKNTVDVAIDTVTIKNSRPLKKEFNCPLCDSVSIIAKPLNPTWYNGWCMYDVYVFLKTCDCFSDNEHISRFCKVKPCAGVVVLVKYDMRKYRMEQVTRTDCDSVTSWLYNNNSCIAI